MMKWVLGIAALLSVLPGALRAGDTGVGWISFPEQEGIRRLDLALAEGKADRAAEALHGLLTGTESSFLSVDPESEKLRLPLRDVLAARFERFPSEVREAYRRSYLSGHLREAEPARRRRDPVGIERAARRAPRTPEIQALFHEAALLYADRGEAGRFRACVAALGREDEEVYTRYLERFGTPSLHADGVGSPLLPAAVASFIVRAEPGILFPEEIGTEIFFLDGRVVVATAGGLTGLDPETAETVWTIPVGEEAVAPEGEPPASQPELVTGLPEGRVAALLPLSRLLVVDPTDGRVLWDLEGGAFGVRFVGSPVLVGRDLFLAALRIDTYRIDLFRIDVVRGRVRARIPFGRQADLPLHLAAGVSGEGVCWAASNGGVGHLDPSTGLFRWLHVYAGPLMSREEEQRHPRRINPAVAGRVPVGVRPVGDGWLVFPSDDVRLFLLDREGRRRWTWERLSAVPSYLLGITDDTAIVVEGDEVVCLDLGDGLERWRSFPFPLPVGRGVLDGERAWIPTERGIVEIDLRAGGFLEALIPFPDGVVPGDLAWDGERLWVHGAGRIVCLAPVGGRTVPPLPEDLDSDVRASLDRLLDPDPSVRESAQTGLVEAMRGDLGMIERIETLAGPLERSLRLGMIQGEGERRNWTERILQELPEERRQALGELLEGMLASPHSRGQGVQIALGSVVPEARARLARRLLADTDPHIRIAVLQVIGRPGEPAGVKSLLLGALADPDAQVRETALASLIRGYGGEEDVRRMLLRRATEEHAPSVRRSLIHHLVADSQVTDETLASLAPDPASGIAADLARALLGRGWRPGLAPLLLRIASTPEVDEGLRGEILLRLGARRVAEVTLSLRMMLDDPDLPIGLRDRAAIALLQIDGEDAGAVARLGPRVRSRAIEEQLFTHAIALLGRGAGRKIAVTVLMEQIDQAHDNPSLLDLLAEITGHPARPEATVEFRIRAWRNWWRDHAEEYDLDGE